MLTSMVRSRRVRPGLGGIGVRAHTLLPPGLALRPPRFAIITRRSVRFRTVGRIGKPLPGASPSTRIRRCPGFQDTILCPGCVFHYFSQSRALWVPPHFEYLGPDWLQQSLPEDLNLPLFSHVRKSVRNYFDISDKFCRASPRHPVHGLGTLERSFIRLAILCMLHFSQSTVLTKAIVSSHLNDAGFLTTLCKVVRE
jgi:hypothetical protein